MPKVRNPNRDKAFDIYKKHKGKIDLVEIARELDVSAGTIRGWKSKDNWDEKMNGTFRKNTERSKRKKIEKKEAIVDEVESVVENSDLTDKQRLFCLYYIKSFNAVKAYQNAYGCSYETAAAVAYRLLEKVGVKNEIQKLKKSRMNREFLTPEDIFQKYMDIAFADISDFVELNKNYISLKDASMIDGTIISEVKNGQFGITIKLADRMKALDWLSEHMDMATEEQRVRIAAMKKKAQFDDEEETADDGFLEALAGCAAEDWNDEETETVL